MMQSYPFRVLIIPSAVFLSVMFGASYGSGRETVEFFSSAGPIGGLLAALAAVITYTALLAPSFELARMHQTYEYQGFCQVLLGPGWFLYEIVIALGLVISMSLTVTVGGTTFGDHFGWPVWVGSLGVLVLVIVLTYFGRRIVEQSMMLSMLALFVVLSILVVQLWTGHADRVVAAFDDTAFETSAMLGGAKYAIANGGFVPLLLYSVISIRTRGEAFTAGAVASVAAIVPALVFHFTFMANYPEVTEHVLPTYWMFGKVSTALMLNVYVVVIFVLTVQTGVGLLQGLIERLDAWHMRRRNRPLTKTGHALIAGSAVVASMALGSMGIVALVLRSYTVMSISLFVVFVVPLLTYGVFLVAKGKGAAAKGAAQP